uniref:SLC26A/SulP transporter domain-containing protein n=1 Tax=Thiothrix fructosivorans TaxID=111770 RepID=A0A8B0SP28_9GAMM|nr:hypothetical protein J1836_000045 [Thiothrix fructosivorans]
MYWARLIQSCRVVFSGYVSTGSFNRTGVNYESGAKTPMAAVFAGYC